MYWMGYEFIGASVMDYQAVFQEEIQQETLLDKHFGCSQNISGQQIKIQRKDASM